MFEIKKSQTARKIRDFDTRNLVEKCVEKENFEINIKVFKQNTHIHTNTHTQTDNFCNHQNKQQKKIQFTKDRKILKKK